VLGESELTNNTVGVKFLREQRDQLTLNRDELAAELSDLLTE